MASVSVYNMEGAQVGTIELSDSIFAVPVNEHLVHQAVVAQLANKRQGISAINNMLNKVTEPPIGRFANLIMEHTTASAIATAE